MSTEPGLRERKKEQTRQLLGETAHRLFAERGFDAVTVAEVARAADVSEGTVFNYFPTKEDLFYSQMEAFEEALLDAVRRRPAGESVLAAFRKLMLDRSRRLAEDERPELIATAARIVNASPALQAREREIVDRYTQALAALIAEETGAGADDVVPTAVANALMGAQRALRGYVWGRVLDGLRGPELAADVRKQANRAFARLERGLGDYAVKRRAPS
ncbi:MAG TPA: TetR family transcriptional regulator [Gaiellaceae bacterium]|jgi:AcrR family transcriptional regulator|nr:TetR family transcriptional regulator [Gaiellaceae bacterium]